MSSPSSATAAGGASAGRKTVTTSRQGRVTAARWPRGRTGASAASGRTAAAAASAPAARHHADAPLPRRCRTGLRRAPSAVRQARCSAPDGRAPPRIAGRGAGAGAPVRSARAAGPPAALGAGTSGAATVQVTVAPPGSAAGRTRAPEVRGPGPGRSVSTLISAALSPSRPPAGAQPSWGPITGSRVGTGQAVARPRRAGTGGRVSGANRRGVVPHNGSAGAGGSTVGADPASESTRTAARGVAPVG